MNAILSLSAGGRLSIDGSPLEDDDALEVWLENRWWPSRVSRVGSNWLIVLSDGRVSGGLGLRARRPVAVPQSSRTRVLEAAASLP